MLSRSFATHSLQHRFVDVLERDVDITRNFPALGDRCDQLIAPVGRMSVKQPHPKIAVDLLDLT